MKKILLLVFCFTVCCSSFLFARNVKTEMRIGNKAFKNNDYLSAELNYRKALDSIPSAPDVQYNLGCAIYMQIDSANTNSEEAKERLTTAEKLFNQSGEVFSDKSQKEAAFFNLGNTYLKKGEFDKAIDSYKKSLRINPNNFSTKENLYYAQLLQRQNPNNNKDKNKDKQDQQNNQQQKKNDEQKNDENNQDQNQNKQDNQNEQQEQQSQQQQNISRDDAERILKALQQQENQTQENLEKQKGKPMRASSGKNW